MTAPDGVRLLLSAGRGPQECSWAVARLAHRLEVDAARRGVGVRRLDEVTGERRGTFRSVLLLVTGPSADGFAASWSGTLCWQAPSPYRATSRKNWFVTAQRLDAPAAPAAFSEDDVDVQPCRTGGPGGQHRDKASTAARATHRPTGSVVVVDTERRYSDNRRLAIDLLRRRSEADGAAARRADATARRDVHDDLVRGDPTRTERP